MSDLYDQVGYDYVETVRRLLQRFTFEELADRLGYESGSSITAILKGRTPNHRHGEAMWALHLDVFGCKPPLMQNKVCVGSPQPP